MAFIAVYKTTGVGIRHENTFEVTNHQIVLPQPDDHNDIVRRYGLLKFKIRCSPEAQNYFDEWINSNSRYSENTIRRVRFLNNGDEYNNYDFIDCSVHRLEYIDVGHTAYRIIDLTLKFNLYSVPLRTNDDDVVVSLTYVPNSTQRYTSYNTRPAITTANTSESQVNPITTSNNSESQVNPITTSNNSDVFTALNPRTSSNYTTINYNPFEVVHRSGNETITGARTFSVPSIEWVNGCCQVVDDRVTESFKTMLNKLVEEL